MNEYNEYCSIVSTGDMGMLCNCAVRYALGRKTYVVYAICSIIKGHLSELEDNTIEVMIKDIENPYGDYGDECDKQDWMNLLEALKKERERRDHDK